MHLFTDSFDGLSISWSFLTEGYTSRDTQLVPNEEHSIQASVQHCSSAIILQNVLYFSGNTVAVSRV